MAGTLVQALAWWCGVIYRQMVAVARNVDEFVDGIIHAVFIFLQRIFSDQEKRRGWGSC